MFLLLPLYINGPVDELGSHTLEKYLNLDGFLEKSFKIKWA